MWITSRVVCTLGSVGLAVFVACSGAAPVAGDGPKRGPTGDVDGGAGHGSVVDGGAGHGGAGHGGDIDGGAGHGGDVDGGAGHGGDIGSPVIPTSCPPKEDPGAPVSAVAPEIYPTPRVVAIDSLQARVSTVCVDLSTLPSSSALAKRLPTLVTDAGLTLGSPGSCACDWGISFQTTPLTLSGDAAKAWADGEGKSERYAFTTSSGTDHRARTIVATSSERGALDALRTALALTGQSPVRAADATVVDFPSFEHRGVLEGFYGRSFDLTQRFSLLALSDALRLDTYVYAPKCDCYATQAQWRDAYPTGAVSAWVTTETCGNCEGICQPVSGDDIHAAAEDASKRLIRFVWAFSPFHAGGFDYAQYTQELASMQKKVDLLAGLGVQHFALFIDDIGGTPGAGGNAAQAGQHAMLANALNVYAKTKTPDTHLIIVGNTYEGVANEYTDALGSAVAPDIEILWTGKAIVPDSIAASDLTGIDASLKRKVSIWDNWAYTGALANCAGDVATAATSYFVNPVESECTTSAPQTSLPDSTHITQSLGTIADYAWFAQRYAASDASRAASQNRWDDLMPKLLASPLKP